MAQNHPPPDFIIIGAAKCGTTAMYELLRRHPDIYFSPVKEPHYFSGFDVGEFTNDFRRNNVTDPEYYFSQSPLPQQFQLFLNDPDQYSRLYEDAPEGKIRGEASTSYLYSERAPKAILKHNPDTRLIAILRNPVERAFSHYTMALKYGYTTDDFLTALKKDQAKKEKGWGQSELFLELGHYDEQIERYYHYFPREQIHIVIYEEWRVQPQKTMNGITGFLKTTPLKLPERKTYNVGETPRFALVNRWIHQLGLRQYLADRLPPTLKKNMRSWYLKPKAADMMTAEARVWLQQYYTPRINKLEELLGRDLDIWNK